MVTQELLQEIAGRLVKVYDPLSIYLFGSHAWGVPTGESDVDLLVVVDSSVEKKYRRPTPGRIALYGLGISKDLLVLTRDEFEEYVQDPSTLAKKIQDEGQVLYAKA